MPNIYLSDIAAGRGGFMLTGELPGDRAAVAHPTGDVNGDGIADIVIGAAQNFNGGLGKAYVVFGGQSFESPEALANTGGTLAGFQILGETAWTGWGLSGAGDVNGDGLNDILIGSPFEGTGGELAGAAYVVFGRASMTSVNLADVATGLGGFKLIGTHPYGQIGYAGSMAGIGDVNHDGLDDVLFGAPTDPFSPGQGEAYVVFGTASTDPIDLADVAQGNGGFLIRPEISNVNLGGVTAAVGDLNGDGLSDFGVSASVSGEFYVIYGRSGPWSTVDLADVAAGIGGFKILAEGANESAFPMGAAGDVNGDGIDDLIVAAYTNDQSGEDAGAAYVVFGEESARETVDLAAIARGEGGFKIVGEDAYDETGDTVVGAGDLNGDGYDDLLVSAAGDAEGGAERSGGSFVVFGKADTAQIDLADVANGTGGLKIIGFDGIRAGGTYNVGDFTGDGLTDLAIGGGFYNNEAGATFIISGALLVPPLTLVGTPCGDTLKGGDGNDTIRGLGGSDLLKGLAGDDLLVGGSGNDRLFGATGDDTLLGGLGADRLCGGAGDDQLEGGAGRDHLRGGEGMDVLHSGGGWDLLRGGADSDRFVIEERDGAGKLVVADFASGQDKLDLSAFAFALDSFDDLAPLLCEKSAGTWLRLGALDGPDVLLKHLSVTDLQAGDVLFGEQVLFEDHFDCGELSAEWESKYPVQWVEDGWLHTQDTDKAWPRDSLAVVHDSDPTWTDYAVSLKADFVNGSEWENFTLVLRSDGFDRSSAGNGGRGYEVIFNGVDGCTTPDQNTVYLVRWDFENDGATSLSRTTVPLSDNAMDLDVSLEGGRIRLWVDDDLIFDVTDTDPLPSGGFGVHAIWESEARFDDIQIVATATGQDLIL
jgi:Ca2+-binding RTX toxin-like protein